MKRKDALFVLAILMAELAVPIFSVAQNAEAPQTPEQVAYIRLIEGEVGYQRGDDNQSQWNAAAINVPVMTGDSLYANEQARAEIQLGEGNFLRLGSLAYVGFLQNTDDRFQFKLTSGTATLRIRQLNRAYEVDTPTLAFIPRQAGEYRVNVNTNGDTEVILHEGEGVASIAERGEESLVAPTRLKVLATSFQPEVSAAAARDSWDNWNLERDNLAFRTPSRQYVAPGIYGYDALDAYGSWVNTPLYGWVWTPNGMEAGWQPYRMGRWIWVDPFGWTWVSYEPWGWAPYHYGRWAYVPGVGWSWVPGAPTARQRFAAALVAFTTGSDWFGWFPLGPGDPYVPVYVREVVYVGRPVTQYVNYSHVTVINRTEIYNTTYVYNTRVIDRRVIEKTQAVTVCPLKPQQQNLYVPLVRHVSNSQGLTGTAPTAALQPPVGVSHRPVQAKNVEVPVVRGFDEKSAEIERTGVARPINPFQPNQKSNVTVQAQGSLASGTKGTGTGSASVAAGGAVKGPTVPATPESKSWKVSGGRLVNPTATTQQGTGTVPTSAGRAEPAPSRSSPKVFQVPTQRQDHPTTQAPHSPLPPTPRGSTYQPPAMNQPGSGAPHGGYQAPHPQSGKPVYQPPQVHAGAVPPTSTRQGGYQTPRPQTTQPGHQQPPPKPTYQQPRTEAAPQQVQQPRPQPAQQTKPQQQQQQQQQQNKPKPKPPQP